MRKIFILALIVILVGCGKKEEAPTTYSINYNDDNYQIYMPYKKGVGNNYIINNNVVDFDINTIEKGLIQLSTNHFTIDKYYYQEGQYLKEKDLKTLLSKDNLNDNEKIKIDNNSVKPTVVVGIFEKDFVDADGKLQGMSLGLVLNPYQEAKKNSYVTIKNSTVIDIGKKASQKLLDYVRSTYDLNDLPILIGLYIEASPDVNTSGNYQYYGFTEDNTITFNYIDQKQYYLNSSNVKKMDVNSYNNYRHLVDEIHAYDNSIYVSALGYFSGNNLAKVDITITKSYYSYGELLYICNLLSENIVRDFLNTDVVINVKAINDIQANIVKQAEETTTDIFIY